jgi:hypothetical protein
LLSFEKLKDSMRVPGLGERFASDKGLVEAMLSSPPPNKMGKIPSLVA